MCVKRFDPSAVSSPGSKQSDFGGVEARSRTRLEFKATSRRKREKPQLSCNTCRQRKLRCDRAQPHCLSCTNRGLECSYPDNYEENLLSQVPAVPSVLDRLVQLETLVASIQPKQPSEATSTGSNNNGESDCCDGIIPPQLESDRGKMEISASELHYVSGEHWKTILDSIADIKSLLGRDEELTSSMQADSALDDCKSDPKPFARRPSHANLLYGSHPCTRTDILATLSSKGVVDRYISHYFNRADLVSTTIHGPTFLQQYEDFWAEPSRTPIIWVGLLFGMICLSILSSETADSFLSAEGQWRQLALYRERVVQCLIIGEYTSTPPYALEAMIHYVYIELAIRGDTNKDIRFLLAIEVNLAMRMGYHRDPSHFPGLSPLQAEMRRRVWSTVLLGDGLISSQMGMPRMVSDVIYDTGEPQNLNDADIGPDTQELPVSRPETEYTTVLPLIAERRVMVAVGTVSDLVLSPRPYSYENVLRVNQILDAAAASVPGLLKAKAMAASMTDSPRLIMARLFVSLLSHMGKIMLHQRSASLTSSAGAVFAYSRDACLDACLGTLQIQHILEEETASGGQLQMMRWRLSSLMKHHFLTATMILSSSIHRGLVQNTKRKAEIISTLRHCLLIWLRNSTNSQEAVLAARAVSTVLANEDKGDDIHDGKGPDQNDVAVVDTAMGDPGWTRPVAPAPAQDQLHPTSVGYDVPDQATVNVYTDDSSGLTSLWGFGTDPVPMNEFSRWQEMLSSEWSENDGLEGTSYNWTSPSTEWP